MNSFVQKEMSTICKNWNLSVGDKNGSLHENKARDEISLELSAISWPFLTEQNIIWEGNHLHCLTVSWWKCLFVCLLSRWTFWVSGIHSFYATGCQRHLTAIPIHNRDKYSSNITTLLPGLKFLAPHAHTWNMAWFELFYWFHPMLQDSQLYSWASCCVRALLLRHWLCWLQCLLLGQHCIHYLLYWHF